MENTNYLAHCVDSIGECMKQLYWVCMENVEVCSKENYTVQRLFEDVFKMALDSVTGKAKESLDRKILDFKSPDEFEEAVNTIMQYIVVEAQGNEDTK